MTNNYTDSEIRALVEEYIIRQKVEFTFNGVCSYILYWAVEEGKVAGMPDAMPQTAQGRINRVLESILKDGRLIAISGDEIAYKRAKN